MKRAIALALLIWLAAVSSAPAQTTDANAAANGSGSQLVMFGLDPNSPAYVAPQVEHLFGDLWGLRTDLENKGIYVRLTALTEFAGNTGGTHQGATAANQVAFSADIDWQRLAGLTGLSTHVILVNRSGANDSHLFGDNISPVQEIYGAGGDVAIHLVSAYAEEKLFQGRLDLAAGWMNVENDFASSPLYCNYMNNDLCGDPKALPGGDIGHSAYPDAVWGGRVRVRPIPSFYTTIGVYEVNQDLYSQADSSGFEFGIPRQSGIYVPIQFGYEPKYGPDQLPGHYVVGFGYDSSRFKNFADVLPSASVLPAATHHGNLQFWLLTDQMLIRNGPGAQDGIIALAGYVHNDDNSSAYAQQTFVGLLDRGFWQERPADNIALLFTYIQMSSALARVQTEEQELGIPISNSATGVQGHEILLEANYNIHVYRGVDFRPDFQYIIRPNAQSNIHNAAVFGFRATCEF
jgi:porin